jgi:hypothetical protein
MVKDFVVVFFVFSHTFSPILPANLTGQQFSKMDDSNKAPVISGWPRTPSSTNGCFRSVQVSDPDDWGEPTFVGKKGFHLAASTRCSSRFAIANKTIRLQWSYRSFAFKNVMFLGLNVPCAR